MITRTKFERAHRLIEAGWHYSKIIHLLRDQPQEAELLRDLREAAGRLNELGEDVLKDVLAPCQLSDFDQGRLISAYVSTVWRELGEG